MLKSNKGITLVALVVTIIVLIILAAVSISLILGDNGIITRAQQASKDTATNSALEIEDLNLADIEAQNMIDKATNQARWDE